MRTKRLLSWWRGGRAFTLVELLVVIAIIGVLSSLLLPALSKARETGKRVVCVSNMRNIYQATQMYVTDWNEWLPLTNYNAQHLYFVYDYLKPNLNGGVKNDLSGILIFGSPNGVCFCPSLSVPPSSSPCWRAGVDTSSTIAYLSCYMQTWTYGGGGWNFYDNPTAAWVLQRRLSAVKDGSAILVEKNWRNTTPWNANSIYQCANGCVTYASTSNFDATNGGYAPGWNHALSANFLFKDGHVSSYKWTGAPLFDYTYTPLNP